MARILSLHRRRSGLVDITFQAVPGSASYNFLWASNFDASTFTLFANVPVGSGLSSVSVAPPNSASGYFMDGSSNFRGITRFVFNPADYSIPDTFPFWVKVQSIAVAGAGTAGVTGPASAPHLFMPYAAQPNRPIVLNGNAPSGAGVTGSLELILPMQNQNLVLQNLASGTSNPLFVAFEPGGPEFEVFPLNQYDTQLSLVYSSITRLYVRGPAGPTPFNAVLSQRDNPNT